MSDKVEALYKCPTCGHIGHKLTEAVRFDKEADGSMLSMREKFRSLGWESFDEEPYVKGADMTCIGECGNSLADPADGRLYPSCIVIKES